jgi:pyruvate dehydrogenase E1 component
VFYYLTVTNENYRMPAMPAGAEQGILRGMYLLRPAASDADKPKQRVQLMGCGTILREVLAAADTLERDYNVAADVWSVTSFTELARDGIATERWNRLHPEAPPRSTWVETSLRDHAGPAIAATDYVRAFAEPIRAWVDRPYTVLGTDGFGRSDTRELLRRFFEIDRGHITVAALKALADQEALPAATIAGAIRKFGINADAAAPWRT